MGVEPTTLCLEGRCSSQLSYTRKVISACVAKSAPIACPDVYREATPAKSEPIV